MSQYEGAWSADSYVNVNFNVTTPTLYTLDAQTTGPASNYGVQLITADGNTVLARDDSGVGDFNPEI